MKILLTGGTAQLGKKLLQLYATADVQFDVLTRNTFPSLLKHINYIQADLTQPGSLTTINNQYDAVIHCASDPRNADAIDNTGTANLIEVLQQNPPGHFIYISIVGVDKTSFPYYVNKRKAEQHIQQSGIPYTILRFTQFHEFVYHRILNINKDKAEIIVPAELRFQSISLADVCIQILKTLHSRPINSIIEIGGPEIYSIEEMAETYRQLKQESIAIEPVTTLNDFQKLFTTGINICGGYKTGTIKWRDFVIAQLY